MALSVLGTAANVFGVITPAKDLGEIIKGIADSIHEVKTNDESISYWDSTLQEHVKEVFSFMMQCRVAGANESQLRSLQRLSLNILRKEIIENSRRSYLTKLWTSGDIGKKIERVERKMKHCQDLFVVDTLTTHTSMLMQVNREVREIANREGRNYVMERTTIRWKVPGKADSSDPMLIEYAHLAKKSLTLIDELKSNLKYVQERLLSTGHIIKALGFDNAYYPEGNPLSELDSAACRTIRSSEMLRARDFNDTSFIKWLTDNEGLSSSLYNVGLTKEARQLEEFMCQMWSLFASRRGSTPIFSRLACSLHDLATDYYTERRHAEALSHVEQAIRIYRGLGDSFLPNLARCLSDRSDYLCGLGRFGESLESAEESVGMWRRLVDDDPSLYGLDLVLYLSRQADTLYHLSRHEEALRCSQEALQSLSNLTPRNKQVYPAQYAHVSWLIAKSHHNLGDLEQAKEYGRRALSVYHAFLRDRPLYYSQNLYYTLIYSSWFDHESALSVLNESLTVCLTVDTTFTAPQLADILDRRAAVLISSSRYAEALDSCDQAIDVRHRLFKDEDDGSEHFEALLQSFRLRASCMLTLHRHWDALSTLDAAQDAIVSRLKSEIGENIKTYIIRELKEERKLMEGCTGPDCIELISSLRSCKKVLSHIHEIKYASMIGNTARQDLGRLSTLENHIHMMVGSLDLALLSIQDAVDFYRSQIEQNTSRSTRADLVASLVLRSLYCVHMDRLEEALCSMNDTVDQLRADLERDVEGCISKFTETFDLYFNISDRLLHEKNYYQHLRLFLETAIGILQSPIMTSHTRKTPTLAWMLLDKAHLLYNLGSYGEAISASEESVDIRRKLMAEDEWRKWDLAFSLYWLAKSQLVTGDATAAWTTVEEGINIIVERGSLYRISEKLRNLIFLRGDILFCLGRAPDVRDALLESLLVEITPSRNKDSESIDGDDCKSDAFIESGSEDDDESESNDGDDCKSDAFIESGSEDDDESESESAYVSAVDDSDLDD